jgi:hypothetical protein
MSPVMKLLRALDAFVLGLLLPSPGAPALRSTERSAGDELCYDYHNHARASCPWNKLPSQDVRKELWAMRGCLEVVGSSQNSGGEVNYIRCKRRLPCVYHPLPKRSIDEIPQ